MHLVRDKLLARLSARQMFHSDGLGIDGDLWRTAGGTVIPSRTTSGLGVAVSQKLQRLFDGDAYLVQPREPDPERQPAVILGSVNRLQLIPDALCTKLTLPRLWRTAPTNWRSDSWSGPCDQRWAPDLRTTTCCAPPSTSTSSAMSSLAGRLGRELIIVLDGYHPSNYPESYIPGFGEGYFAAMSHLSAAWFERHGREVVPGLWFQEPVHFSQCRCAGHPTGDAGAQPRGRLDGPRQPVRH